MGIPTGYKAIFQPSMGFSSPIRHLYFESRPWYCYQTFATASATPKCILCWHQTKGLNSFKQLNRHRNVTSHHVDGKSTVCSTAWSRKHEIAHTKAPHYYFWRESTVKGWDPLTKDHPDSKVHGDNMGPTWVLSAPDGPMLAPWTLLSGKLCGKRSHGMTSSRIHVSSSA